MPLLRRVAPLAPEWAIALAHFCFVAYCWLRSSLYAFLLLQAGDPFGFRFRPHMARGGLLIPLRWDRPFLRLLVAWERAGWDLRSDLVPRGGAARFLYVGRERTLIVALSIDGLGRASYQCSGPHAPLATVEENIDLLDNSLGSALYPLRRHVFQPQRVDARKPLNGGS